MRLADLLQSEGYANLTDSAKVALANEKRHAVSRDTFHTYRSLASTADGIGPDPTRRLIQTIDIISASDPLVGEMRYSLRGERGLNVRDQSTLGMLAMFAASDQLPLTAEDVDAITALSSSLESDADQNGLGVVTVEQINRLRIDGDIQ
jgi:hypothetical protein